MNPKIGKAIKKKKKYYILCNIYDMHKPLLLPPYLLLDRLFRGFSWKEE